MITRKVTPSNTHNSGQQDLTISQTRVLTKLERGPVPQKSGGTHQELSVLNAGSGLLSTLWRKGVRTQAGSSVHTPTGLRLQLEVVKINMAPSQPVRG